MRLLGSLPVTVTALILTALAPAALAAPIVGLTTSNSLVTFNSDTPSSGGAAIGITGLFTGETVLGIDYRPATNSLYGITNQNRLYTINANTGAATFASALSTGASSAQLGVDFNPVPDRLRVVGTADENLRINVDTGATIVDGTLAYAAGDVNAGANPNIIAAAYTNSFAGATTTTLYGIDSLLGILVTQNPPNNGTLNTVGSLGLAGVILTGFDIDGATGQAFANSASTLYRINLATGAATAIGGFTGNQLADIAVQPVPEPGTMLLLSAGLGGLLWLKRRRVA